MAKAKKITASSLVKAIGLNKSDRTTLLLGEGENQVKVTVKNRLSILERANMIDSIVSMVWIQGEDDVEHYAPYLKQFAFGFNILNYFSDASLPDDMNKVWDLIDSTDIVNYVVDAIGPRYVEDILKEANEAIEYHKSETLKKSKFDNLLDSIQEVVATLNDKTENIDINNILDFLQKESPELKGEFEKLIKTHMADAVAEGEVEASVE